MSPDVAPGETPQKPPSIFIDVSLGLRVMVAKKGIVFEKAGFKPEILASMRSDSKSASKNGNIKVPKLKESVFEISKS